MKKLKHIFDNIFYLAYTKEEKSWLSVPVLYGLISVSLIINLYLFILIILIEIIFKIPLLSLPKEELFPYIILFSTVVLVINYFIYGYKKKYVLIIKKYEAKTEEYKKKIRLKTQGFILFSMILFIIVFVIGVNI